MKKITDETMATIRAIQCYKDKYGNDEAVIKYYQEHGTYAGIVEFLQGIEEKNNLQ